ncbi:sphingomyelin phosphodiesterase-like [Photinus pyralis]|uniref:Sphingomyelin phosphodiesterase n=1 Tax=Photinus pyralis TaxID=7054 RepID=A0A1Y1M3V8_PHOPY|nr:sphingomyelin phosphodiesterase-like [Photinus pyralis]
MIFTVIVTVCLLGCVTATEDDNWEATVSDDLLEFMRTEERSQRLQQELQGMEFPKLCRERRLRIFDFDPLACSVCRTVVGTVLRARKLGFEKDRFVFVLKNLCTWLKIEKEEVCEGVIRHNIDTLIYIVDNRPKLKASQVCAIVFQNLQCKDTSLQEWSLALPPYEAHNVSLVRESKFQNEQNGSFRIVQITDLHYDPEYSVGSNTDCGLPICCQNGSVPESEATAAGFWGDYRDCDPPWNAVVDLVQHIKQEHKNIGYIYFTGDIVAHKVHDTSKDRNTKDVTKVYKELKKVFGDIPIYPVLGNHEAHPVNQFTSEDVNPDMEISTRWIFSLAAELWRDWLPPEATKTILRGGYYTALVRPGFRVIALNSNVCYSYNFWLLYEGSDPYGQLQWLIDTLLDAETNNEKVHILSHVPSGDSSCVKNWGREYVNIVNRFSHVISAQFNGHTHWDDTVIYYSNVNRSEAINVAFNGGSFTTYSLLNPNYKVYDVDAAQMDVTNFESWTYNITEANERSSDTPKWYKLYDFKSAYNVSSLHPQELSRLVERMTKEKSLTQSYFRYKNRDADPTIAKGCKSDCELENICTMVTSAHGDDYHCKMYTRMYKKNRR